MMTTFLKNWQKIANCIANFGGSEIQNFAYELALPPLTVAQSKRKLADFKQKFNVIPPINNNLQYLSTFVLEVRQCKPSCAFV